MASFQEVHPLNSIRPTNNFSNMHHPNQIVQAKRKTKIVHKYKFTKEEDEKLCLLVNHFGENNWSLISKNMKNRNARQCRERWKNYINPKLSKNEWTEEDDQFLIKKFQEIGPHWNKITQYFHNRSSNSVRNRFVRLYKKIYNKPFSNKINNNYNYNYYYHQNQQNRLINQYNSFQAFPTVQNNFIMFNHSFINNPYYNNTIQLKGEKQVPNVDSFPTQIGSSEIIKKNESKNQDPFSEKKDYFDLFWNACEENDDSNSSFEIDY